MKKALTLISLTAASITAMAQSVSAQIIIGTTATQGQVSGGALLSLLALAQTLVTRLVPFVVGLAVLAFFWFLVEFIWLGRNDPKKHEEGLKGMGYSIIALFVMVSVWGLVGFLGSVLGVGQGGSVPIPGIPVPTQ